MRVLAGAQEERARALRQDRIALDDAVRERLIATTTDFKTVWRDPDLLNCERKQLLAYVIEDVTLLKFAAEERTRIHVRFKGGKTGRR